MAGVDEFLLDDGLGVAHFHALAGADLREGGREGGKEGVGKRSTRKIEKVEPPRKATPCLLFLKLYPPSLPPSLPSLPHLHDALVEALDVHALLGLLELLGILGGLGRERGRKGGREGWLERKKRMQDAVRKKERRQGKEGGKDVP